MAFPKCTHCCGTGKEPDQKKVGGKMKKMRTAVSKSGAEVAKAMAISPSYLSQLESGEKTWTLDLRTRFKNAVNPEEPTGS